MSAYPFPHRSSGPDGARRDSFSLYAAGGHIYAQNRRAMLIELGSVERRDDGFLYRVDGAPRLCGSRFAGADDVLHDLARRLDGGFLEGRFATQQDHAEDYDIDLNGAAHLEIALDTGFGERVDAQALAAAAPASGPSRLAR